MKKIIYFYKNCELEQQGQQRFWRKIIRRRKYCPASNLGYSSNLEMYSKKHCHLTTLFQPYAVRSAFKKKPLDIYILKMFWGLSSMNETSVILPKLFNTLTLIVYICRIWRHIIIRRIDKPFFILFFRMNSAQNVSIGEDIIVCRY